MRVLLALAFVIVTAVAAFTYRDLILRGAAPARAVVRRPALSAPTAGPTERPTPRARDLSSDHAAGVGMSTDPLVLAVVDSLIDLYMLGLREHPLDVRAMADLAFLYMRHGWFDRAIGPLARAREVDPLSEPLRRYLELALARAGLVTIDLDQAAREFAMMAEMWGDGC
jgi:hypothetical protein